jgi:hypothetical protein
MTGADLSALDADALLSAAEDNERVSPRGGELWRLPHGRHFLVDQTGTTAVTAVPSD